MTQTELESKTSHPKENHQSKPLDRKERPLTKVIIRRLPPTLDQESFLNQVSPVPDYDYIYTVRGDASLGEHSFSRVYINFTNPSDIFAFKEKFDNYVFLDNKGHEYPAVVEFASFQKIPKKRNKNRIDAKCGTIETDPIYLEFLESLKAQPTQEEKPEYSYQLMTENKNDTTTPLLEYIKQKRMERQRIREEKREERKKRELERKKLREDERKKRFEEKSPVKTVVIKANNYANKQDEKDSELSFKDTDGEDIKEKPTSSTVSYKSKERKYEDKKFVYSKSKYQQARSEKRDYLEKKEYKSKRDDFKEYKSKYYEDNKKDSEQKFPKKVKKYSERREERKMEALKAGQKSDEQKDTQEAVLIKAEKVTIDENTEVQVNVEKSNKSSSDERQEKEDIREADEKSKEKEEKASCKENDPRVQRRIRNKDRPTMALYQPGMLSKRKQVDGGDSDSKDSNPSKD